MFFFLGVGGGAPFVPISSKTFVLKQRKTWQKSLGSLFLFTFCWREALLYFNDIFHRQCEGASLSFMTTFFKLIMLK